MLSLQAPEDSHSSLSRGFASARHNAHSRHETSPVFLDETADPQFPTLLGLSPDWDALLMLADISPEEAIEHKEELLRLLKLHTEQEKEPALPMQMSPDAKETDTAAADAAEIAAAVSECLACLVADVADGARQSERETQNRCPPRVGAVTEGGLSRSPEEPKGRADEKAGSEIWEETEVEAGDHRVSETMGLPPASHHARGRHDGLALHHEHAAQEEEALESALSELERFVHAALEDRRNGRRARPSPHTAEEGMTGDGGSIWPDRSVVKRASGESEGVPERLSISRIMLEKELQRMREMEARESEWELCVGGKARREPELSISEMIEEEDEVTSSASSPSSPSDPRAAHLSTSRVILERELQLLTGPAEAAHQEGFVPRVSALVQALPGKGEDYLGEVSRLNGEQQLHFKSECQVHVPCRGVKITSHFVCGP